MPPPVLMKFVVFPPGCGYSVADFWGWDAHEMWLRCSEEVSGICVKMRYQDGPLNLNLLTTQIMVTMGIFPTRKNPHGRTGNRTQDLMISSQKPWPLDHEASRKLIIYSTVKVKFTLYPGMKADRGNRSTHCLILMLGGDGGNSMPWLFYPREWHGTHCIRSWKGPRTSLDMCGKSHPHWDSVIRPSSL